jgi:hypothetical protein
MSDLRVESIVVGFTAFALAAGCAARADTDPPGVEPVELPLAVSSVFAPSGYMGDGAGGTAVVADTECAPRPGSARGDCYRFTYKAGPLLWSGVYWQFPANNWGAAEGKAIPPGANQVSFYAAGAKGGEVLTIKVGGIRDVTLPYSDTISATDKFTLTTEMTQYKVDLGGQSYDKVIGGFSWATAYPEGTVPGSAAPIVFFLDDLVWE